MKITNKFIALILFISLFMSGCSKTNTEQQTLSGGADLNFNISESITSEDIYTEEPEPGTIEDEELFKVYFMDVGQAHCVIAKYNDIEFLIDGGNYDDGEYITNYMKSLNVDNIEYIIATHPHEDHIGGLPKIMSYFSVDNIYTPYIEDKYKPTTKIYNSLNVIIDTKDINEYNPKNGDVLFSDENLKVEILFDGRIESNDLNDYSLVTKLTYKDKSFLITGDSTTPSEKLLINNLKNENDLKSDVLLVGHHGSSTSTSDAFLNLVSPEYCVISCGINNEYGHPHKEILKKISNIKTYRTDLNGNIIAETNGTTIKFITQNTNDVPIYNEEVNKNENNETYIGNINSKKFHNETCKSLPSERNSIYFTSIEEALNEGYEKCGNCFN